MVVWNCQEIWFTEIFNQFWAAIIAHSCKQNCQKVHENYKIGIFGSKQCGWDKPIFWVVRGGGDLPTLTKVKYTLGIVQIYWKYTSKVYLKYTSSVLKAYFKYTSSILQKYFKYTSTCWITKEEVYFKSSHFVKLNQYFNVKLKYTSSIL